MQFILAMFHRLFCRRSRTSTAATKVWGGPCPWRDPSRQKPGLPETFDGPSWGGSGSTSCCWSFGDIVACTTWSGVFFACLVWSWFFENQAKLYTVISFGLISWKKNLVQPCLVSFASLLRQFSCKIWPLPCSGEAISVKPKVVEIPVESIFSHHRATFECVREPDASAMGLYKLCRRHVDSNVVSERSDFERNGWWLAWWSLEALRASLLPLYF